MANAPYEKFRQNLLEGNIDWLSGSGSAFAVVLCASEYSENLVTDQTLSDISAANRVASAYLETLSASDGVADAADVTFSSVSGSNIYSAVVFRATGADATASLMVFIDTGTGFPLTPNGGDISLTWSSGGCRIYRV